MRALYSFYLFLCLVVLTGCFPYKIKVEIVKVKDKKHKTIKKKSSKKRARHYVKKKRSKRKKKPINRTIAQIVPSAYFQINHSSAFEEDGEQNIIVELSQQTKRAVTLYLDILQGSATSGQDFQLLQKSVTIPAGKTQGEVKLKIIDDKQKESVDESVRLKITSAKHARVDSRNVFEFVILDNDH